MELQDSSKEVKIVSEMNVKVCQFCRALTLDWDVLEHLRWHGEEVSKNKRHDYEKVLKFKG